MNPGPDMSVEEAVPETRGSDSEPAASEARRRDHERFARLLESMEHDRKSGADAMAIASIRETIRKFQAYQKKHGIALDGGEQGRISAIATSGRPPLVKKRMIEDLIHEIRRRHESAADSSRNAMLAQREIDELERARGTLRGWVQLVRLSLTYGTVTPFRHRLRRNCLASSLERVRSSLDALAPHTVAALDEEYYLLTILEYNALEAMLRLLPPLNDLLALPFASSYGASEISGGMDAFTEVYSQLLCNAAIVESSMHKAFSERKPPHGMMGSLMELLDRPLFNNRPVFRSPGEMMSGSVTGMLLSYYSCRAGCAVKTLRQAMHVAGCDGAIESSRKRLTAGAIEREKAHREKNESEEARMLRKYRDLARITDGYLPHGEAMEAVMLRIESGQAYQHAVSEHSSRPLLRLRRLVENYMAFFLDVVKNPAMFVLEYDGVEYAEYFSGIPRISEEVGRFCSNEYNLLPSMVSEIVRLTLPQGKTAEEYLAHLVRADGRPTGYTSGEQSARAILLDLRESAYRLASSLGGLISEYYNRRELAHEKITTTYDFYLSARAVRLRGTKTALAAGGKDVTLKSFLEGACAVAYHIARLGNHPVIEAIVSEKAEMALRMEHAGVIGGDGPGNDVTQTMAVAGDGPTAQGWRDVVTGFWMREYLEDRVLPELYDSAGRLRADGARFIFAASIDRLRSINEVYGHDAGDALMAAVAKKVTQAVNAAGMPATNAVIRYEGNLFVGFLNGVQFATVADTLNMVLSAIGAVTVEMKGDIVGPASMSIGVYMERRGAEIGNSVRVAKALMEYASSKGGNNIGYVKNQDRVIAGRDFSGRNALPENLITLLRRR